MRKIIISLLAITSLASSPLSSKAQTTSFNYNKWKAEQETAEKKEKIHSFDENFLSPTTAYLDGFIQLGCLRGVGGTIGGYFKNINLEASYIYGLTESYQIERIFADAHHAFTYRPTYLGFKTGYSFGVVGCLRITPQVGIGFVQIHGLQANENATRSKETAYATCLSGGIKVGWAFTNHFSMILAPEYITKIGNSESYNKFTDTTGQYVSKNSSVKELVNWTKGFRIRIGLEVSL